jgi:TseV toxin immunity protein TsiV
MEDDLKTLKNLLDIRDPKGRVALTFGLFATFYLEQPWTRAVREAVSVEAERYIALVRDSLIWTEDPKTASLYRIDKGRVAMPGQWVPNHEDGKGWEFGLHGGEDKDSASAIQVSALGPTHYRDDYIGYFHVRLPIDWFVNHPGKLPDFVLPICKRLRPLSGYAGIGLLTPLTFEGCKMTGRGVLSPIAKRFPGIEVDDPVTTSIHAAYGIKGVNWLTILGDRWVEEAGGLDYLRIRLDEPNFPFYPYDGGLMIQAGQRPQVGDAERGLWPSQYVTLAKVLRKIQVKEHYQLFASGIFNKEETQEWIYRFDGK